MAGRQDGYVLDEIVQARRNTKAAKRLLTRLLKKQGVPPKRIMTHKLRSYGAARRQVMLNVEHRSHKGLNNGSENSHIPLRKRERSMQGFRSTGGLQRFVSIFSALRNPFRSVRPQTFRLRHPPSSAPRHGGMESRNRDARLKSELNAMSRRASVNLTTPCSSIKVLS